MINKRTVLITGASAGLGEQFARRFSQLGFNLIIVARREKKLELLAEKLTKQYNNKVTPIALDLLQPAGSQRLFDRVNKLELQVDILVNNAATLENGPFAESQLEDIEQLLQLNILALTRLSHLFLGPMIKRRRGRILNISSFVAFVPAANLAVYAATKAYVLHLSEALLEEVKDYGVTVTALCPAGIATDILSGDDASHKQKSLKSTREFMSHRLEHVVEEGVDACLKGSAYHIPGRLTRAMIYASKLEPRWLARKMMNRIAD